MTANEYVLGLLLIFSGLAISDMIASLHGLLLNRRVVKWDWVALGSAVYILLVVINSWGVSFRAFNRADEQLQLWSFLLVLLQIVPLYLAARASLPDQVSDETDLGRHYAAVSRYFWTSIAISFTLYLLIGFREGPFMQNMRSEWTAVAQLGPDAGADRLSGEEAARGPAAGDVRALLNRSPDEAAVRVRMAERRDSLAIDQERGNVSICFRLDFTGV